MSKPKDDATPTAEFLHVAAYREGDRIEYEVTIDEWALLWDKPTIAALLHGAAHAVRVAAEDFGPPLAHRDGPPLMRPVPDAHDDDGDGDDNDAA